MIEFRIKEKTRSLNESFRGDWRPRAAVAKRQRTKAMQSCPKWPGGPLLCVRLTRVSPGTLDKANLAGSLKHIEDGVAARLGVDDASPIVEWEYHQTKGEAEVVVQIWKTGEADPSPPVGRATNLRKASTVKGGLKPSSNSGTRCGKSGCRKHRPCADHDGTMKGWAAGMVESAYTPPRSKPVDAAREAEETFATAPVSSQDECARRGCGHQWAEHDRHTGTEIGRCLVVGCICLEFKADAT